MNKDKMDLKLFAGLAFIVGVQYIFGGTAVLFLVFCAVVYTGKGCQNEKNNF